MKKIIGFIFARGGSKGVKNKNIRIVNNKPLIAYAIESAKKSKYINRVIVSTDSQEIANIALKYGAEIPFLRPFELAQDDSPEILSWKHAIKELNEKIEVFVSIPTTAPLRKTSDIDRCIDELLNSDADLVITGKIADRNPYFNMVKLDHQGYASLVISQKEIHTYRRQDAPPIFDITTVAYAAKPQYILETDNLYLGKVRLVEVPKENALDIDDEYDLILADILLKQRENES